MRARLAVLGCVVTATALGVVGVAALGASAAVISDPIGDTRSAPLPAGVRRADVDITQASVKKNNGYIEMEVRVVGSSKRLLASTDASPAFSVKEGSQFYFVSVGPDGYDVFDTTNGGKPVPAKVTRPDGQTVKVKFKAKAIGNPAKYQWRVTNGACVVWDYAPKVGFTSSKSAKRC